MTGMERQGGGGGDGVGGDVDRVRRAIRPTPVNICSGKRNFSSLALR